MAAVVEQHHRAVHYSSRADLAVELANLEKIRERRRRCWQTAPLAEIAKDPALLALGAGRAAKAAFGDNSRPATAAAAPAPRLSQSERR